MPISFASSDSLVDRAVALTGPLDGDTVVEFSAERIAEKVVKLESAVVKAEVEVDRCAAVVRL